MDEVTGASFGYILKSYTPAHARSPAHHIDDTFNGTVMMGTGSSARMNIYGAGPQVLSSMTRRRDRRGTIHAGGLRSVGVEFGSPNNMHTVISPVTFNYRRCIITSKGLHGFTMPHAVAVRLPHR